jgi:hypothetical protein
MEILKRFKMPKFTDEEKAKQDVFYPALAVAKVAPKPTESEVKAPEVSVETPAENVETPQFVAKPENVIVIPEPQPDAPKKEKKPRAPRPPVNELRVTKVVAEMIGQTYNGLTVLSLNEEHTLLHTCGSRAVNVRCECGREFYANPYYVKGGQTKCECKRKHKKEKPAEVAVPEMVPA